MKKDDMPENGRGHGGGEGCGYIIICTEKKMKEKKNSRAKRTRRPGAAAGGRAVGWLDARRERKKKHCGTAVSAIRAWKTAAIFSIFYFFFISLLTFSSKKVTDDQRMGTGYVFEKFQRLFLEIPGRFRGVVRIMFPIGGAEQTLGPEH